MGGLIFIGCSLRPTGFGKVVCVKPIQHGIEQTDIQLQDGKEPFGDFSPRTVDRSVCVPQRVEIQFSLFILDLDRNDTLPNRERRE